MVNLRLKHTGAALITALITVFIVMAIVSNIAVKNYRVIRSLTNQKVKDQSYYILMSAVALARAGLATSGATTQIDTLQDLWAQPIPKTEIVDGISMSGYVSDEQGKFNINDLVNKGNVNTIAVGQFANLLSYINVPSSVAYNIAYYMASPRNQTNIMSLYTTAIPPYRPAGRPMVDLSELFLVKGVTSDMITRMSPYITAIPVSLTYLLNESTESSAAFTPESGSFPGGMLVNVNTAPAQVIAARSGMSLPVAQRMVTARTGIPFKSTTDITNFLSSNGIIQSSNNPNSPTGVNLNALTTQSSYFTVHAIADKGDYEFKWVALLYRPARNGVSWPQVLWQHPE